MKKNLFTAIVLIASTSLAYSQTNKVGVNTKDPAETLHVNGTFRLDNSSKGLGKILVSDANGTATWTDPTVQSNDWKLTGNSGTSANSTLGQSSTNYLGTTDNVSLVLATGGTSKAILGTDGSLRGGGQNSSSLIWGSANTYNTTQTSGTDYNNSIVLGSNNSTAGSFNSVAIGTGNTISHKTSNRLFANYAFGTNNTISGNLSGSNFSIGKGNNIEDTNSANSYVFGFNNQIKSNTTFIFGYENSVDNNGSAPYIFGYSNSVIGKGKHWPVLVGIGLSVDSGTNPDNGEYHGLYGFNFASKHPKNIYLGTGGISPLTTLSTRASNTNNYGNLNHVFVSDNTNGPRQNVRVMIGNTLLPENNGVISAADKHPEQLTLEGAITLGTSRDNEVNTATIGICDSKNEGTIRYRQNASKTKGQFEGCVQSASGTFRWEKISTGTAAILTF